MNYKKLKKDELKELCNKRGLSVDGTNDDMIVRLKAAEAKITTGEIFSMSNEDLPSYTTKKGSNLFLHIRTANLSNYFTYGYIYPLQLEESDIYKTENRLSDILTYFPNYIVASYGPINSFDSGDVLVEFIPSDIDSYAFDNTDLLIISQPIPISRIVAINFKTEKDKASFVASVKSFPDNFVPESICHVYKSEIALTQIDFSKIDLPVNPNINIWPQRLDFFDKLMGLFSFIKNVGILYGERENRLDEYLPSFFAALNLVNSVPALSRFKENSFLRPLFKELEITSVQRLLFRLIIDRIKANELFSLKISIGLLETVLKETNKPDEKIEINEIISHFKNLDRLVIAFPDLLALEKINRNYPVLILLFLSKFPNKSRLNTDKQAVRTFFIGDGVTLPINVAEYVLGVLGFYYGYKSMVKADTNLRFNDKYFQTVADQIQSIKFKLDDFLDRFIIESCFNYSITQKQLNMPYFFLQQSKHTTPAISKPFSNPHVEYSIKYTDVLGHDVISIARIGKLDKIISELLSRFPEKIQQTSYLYAYFFKHFKLDLHYFIETLKRNQTDIELEELVKIIDMEKPNV